MDKKNKLFSSTKTNLFGGVPQQQSLNENVEHSTKDILFYLANKIEELSYSINEMKQKHNTLINENHIVPKNQKDVTIIIGTTKFSGKMSNKS